VKELLVFTRPGCHLCEVLIEELEPLCRESAVRLHVVNVDDQPEWVQRFGTRVPVVCSGAREISAYPLDRRAVLAWLRGESG
jgi:thioredoxin-like negative regulator of GroEL